jgi:hypothetical protein
MIRQGRTEEALRLIERMLAAEPGNSVYLVLKMQALQLAERHAEGLAIITQLLATHHFAYDLEELGCYYRDYVDLMDHVDRVLPGRMYRLHYKRLVTDTENEVLRTGTATHLHRRSGTVASF